MASDWWLGTRDEKGEYLFSPYRHFERKREIFFVHGQAKDARTTHKGKRRTPYELETTVFHADTDSHRKEETLAEKDLSTPLGMTIRENGLSHISFHTAAEPTSAPSGHLLPREGGRIHTIPRTKSLPRMGKVASIASRIGYQRDENAREQPSQASALREYPSTAHLTFLFIPSRRRPPLRGRSILRLRRAPSSRGCSAVMQKRDIREYRFSAP